MTSQARPRVFISSTIYDFADFRSALKFWLEELGHEVDTSEAPDFRKDVSANSYDACLAAIDQCDIFILLIGSRAGGWFDRNAGVTITMQEYRRAYIRAQKGEIKLLTFARRSVWDAREDRASLERVLKEDFLTETGLTEERIRAITHHSSRIIRDAQTVFSFLREAGRVPEMKLAAGDEGPLPPANWIHVFNGFRDIVDTLRVELRTSYGVRRSALIRNLQSEMVRNLSHLLQKSKSSGVSPACGFGKFARHSISGELGDHSTMKAKFITWMGLFDILSSGLGNFLSTAALEQALQSGEFLGFDTTSNSHVESHLHRLMQRLCSEIERVRLATSRTDTETLSRLLQISKGIPDDQEISVPNDLLIFPASLYDRCFNILALSRALYLGFTSGEEELPVLAPAMVWGDSPDVPDTTTPCESEIYAWLEDPNKGIREVPRVISKSPKPDAPGNGD